MRDSPASRRVLVTGGAGFIGSHLVEGLLARGDSVRALDDLSTGRWDNISHLEQHPQFSFIQSSAIDHAALAQHVEWAELIFHLAAAVGVRLIVERPVHTIETNIRATENVLELAAASRTKVLLTSTSEVYGKLEKPRFGEEDDLLLGPTSKSRWCYAASKIIDEFLAKAYWKERGVPVVIVRLFNTVGPRQTGQYGMVVPRFIRQALDGEDITVYGDGTQRRSFTWVEDAVRAMIALAEHPGADGEVFNIGHTEEVTIGELALMVKEMTGSASRIVFVPYGMAYEEGFEDMRRRLPDISKAQQFIGYEPSVDLRGILERIIAYHRENDRW